MWFRQRFLKRKVIRKLPQFIEVNTSKAELFFSTIVPEVLPIVERFLNGESITLESANKEFISDPLKDFDDANISQPNYLKRANQIYNCDVCDMEIHSESNWEKHLRGKKHKFNVKKAKRSAEEVKVI